jgi:SNF2 family DNA or RNA helicase
MKVTVSRPNKTLIVPNIAGIPAMFSTAPLFEGQRLIPHGLRETILLRHLGFQVPNPMEYYYDWCGGVPFKVQVKSCAQLTVSPRFYLLNHMGTGKTKTLLWAWDYLNKNKMAKKMLVVAPLSTVDFVWANEVFNTLPGRKVQTLLGSRERRLERLRQDADIYVVNHDGLKVIESELSARADIDTLVLDELAVYRNDSARSKLMRKFADRFTIVWGATGSPMPNEPTDVWSQCRIITPDKVPRFRTHARELLMIRTNQFVWRPKPDAVKRAFSWMQPSCRYTLDEIVELPPLISRTIDAPFSQEQDTVYKNVARELVAMVKEKKIKAVNAGAAMSKLLQIAGGWVYTQNPEFVKLDAAPRLEALTDIIYSAERKIIVAIPFRHMLEGVSEALTKKKIEHCVVHGDTKDRETVFHQFQNTPDAFKVLLVHPECVKHGLTLTAADTMVWYLPTASLDVYDQLNARITRIGQTHKQQLLHLQSTPVERKLYKLLREKHLSQESFLHLVETATEGQ